MQNAKPIIEFVKEKPKYLQLASTDIPAWSVGEGYNKYTYPKFKLDSPELVITKIEEHYAKHGVQISYLDKNLRSRHIIVPNDFLASILPPEKFAEFEAKYALSQERNKLKSELYYSGSTGSDPEIFVVDKDNNLIPAFAFLPDKKNAIKADTHKTGWLPNNIYWDGFQAEFDTFASTCFSGQADSIHFGLQGLLKAARAYDKNARLSLRTVFDIPPDMLAEGKPEHVNFGCMPSLNAYNMKGLELPGHEVPFRPAGGHMHLAFYNLKSNDAVKIVKAMDAILGVACVSLFAQFDDPRRRTLYGLAGEYRLPKHGLEYRVLSNAWLMHPLTAHIVFDLGRTAAIVGRNGMLGRWQCEEAETVRIINECDVEAARKVLRQNEEFLKRVIEVKYMNWWSSGDKLDPFAAAEYVYNAILNGAETIIQEPHNIEANWNLLGADSLVEGKELQPSDYANSGLDGKWRMHSDGSGKNVMFVFKHGLEKKKV